MMITSSSGETDRTWNMIEEIVQGRRSSNRTTVAWHEKMNWFKWIRMNFIPIRIWNSEKIISIKNTFSRVKKEWKWGNKSHSWLDWFSCRSSSTGWWSHDMIIQLQQHDNHHIRKKHDHLHPPLGQPTCHNNMSWNPFLMWKWGHLI